MFLAFAGVFLSVLVWWLCIRPSHERQWRPEVAVMPRAIIDGDRVRITSVRNFDFRARDDFTVGYEEREFSLAHVTSLDLFISYWQVGPVGHTFVSFNFDDGTPPVHLDRARPEIGEGFAPFGSMFKQFELIYLVGDEHDLVASEATAAKRCTSTASARPRRRASALRGYLERINELADRPEFYHLPKNSCTVNIVRYANTAGRRVGGSTGGTCSTVWVDGYLYDAGWVDTTLPFAELRQRPRITDAAKAAAHAPDFSQRRSEPHYRHQRRNEPAAFAVCSLDPRE